jgi:hypothetical protein
MEQLLFSRFPKVMPEIAAFFQYLVKGERFANPRDNQNITARFVARLGKSMKISLNYLFHAAFEPCFTGISIVSQAVKSWSE